MTPKVEIRIPVSCFGFILIFRIKYEKTKIKTGIDEFMISAFVAVVYCNPTYNKVLNIVIPSSDKTDKIIK